MLVTEIRINNVTIGYIKIVNTDKKDSKDSWVYDYTYFNLEDEKIKKGSVSHKREDGANKLIEKIIRRL